jgi:hypothetical protein
MTELNEEIDVFSQVSQLIGQLAADDAIVRVLRPIAFPRPSRRMMISVEPRVTCFGSAAFELLDD